MEKPESFDNIILNFINIKNDIINLKFKVDIIKSNLNSYNKNHYLNFLEEKTNFNKIKELNEKNKEEFHKLKELYKINYKYEKNIYDLYEENENELDELEIFFSYTYLTKYKKIRFEFNKNNTKYNRK
jgi:hypothetical protein